MGGGCRWCLPCPLPGRAWSRPRYPSAPRMQGGSRYRESASLLLFNGWSCYAPGTHPPHAYSLVRPPEGVVVPGRPG